MSNNKEYFLKIAKKFWVLEKSGLDVNSLRCEYVDKDQLRIEYYEDFNKCVKEKVSENIELNLELIHLILSEYILDKLAEKHHIDFDKEFKIFNKELKNLEEDIQKSINFEKLEEDIQKNIKFEILESENIRNYILN